MRRGADSSRSHRNEGDAIRIIVDHVVALSAERKSPAGLGKVLVPPMMEAPGQWPQAAGLCLVMPA